MDFFRTYAIPAIFSVSVGYVIGFYAGRYCPRDRTREAFDKKYEYLWKMQERHNR